jgi:hypothetical protein
VLFTISYYILYAHPCHFHRSSCLQQYLSGHVVITPDREGARPVHAQKPEPDDLLLSRPRSRRRRSYNANDFSIPHAAEYVTRCLQSQLGVSQLRNIGITYGYIRQTCCNAFQDILCLGWSHLYYFEVNHLITDKANPYVQFDADRLVELCRHKITSTRFQSICSAMVWQNENRQLLTEVQRFRSGADPAFVRQCGMFGYSHLDSIISNNETCFVLPFRLSPTRREGSFGIVDASCSLFDSRPLPRLDNGRDMHNNEPVELYESFFENSMNDTLGNRSIIVNGRDLSTLNPGICVNDSIINFFMKWLVFQRYVNDKSTNTHVFNTQFMTRLIADGYSDELKRWVRRIDIFKKSFLIFPCHSSHHWSMFVVVNPGNIMQTSRRWRDESYTGAVTTMIHLDSLGFRTPHNPQLFSEIIRNILNWEWDHRQGNAPDQLSRPFSNRSIFRLHLPQGEFF